MLLILFSIDGQPHALDALSIETVTPALPLREIPGAPSGVVGVFEYQGRMIPVVDLTLLLTGKPSERVLCSRFIIVNTGTDRSIALLAEKVTETLDAEEEALQDTGVKSPGAPFLGKVFRDSEDRIVQCVEPETILPPDVLAALKLEPVSAT